MMDLAELKLIGEFVNATLAAGLIRTVEGAAAASHLANVVRREIELFERFERMKMQGALSLRGYTEWMKKDVSDETLYSSKPIDTTAGSASVSGCGGQTSEPLDAFPRVG